MSDTPVADIRHMARALKLARQGLYSTHPNPRVGCVIVRNGEVVGEGWHLRAGEPHAEVHALRQAGERARGAIAYVTLEPCSHHGRTPPCADALLQAGVARVVAAMQDPNPQVAGQGLQRLAAAGVAVASGVLEAEARALNLGFIKRMEQGLPYVRVKLAMSLDGRTAMASGESQWITGPAARAAVQRLRAQSSVVLSGADTVLTDAARLTVRRSEERF
uniref:bifunctional diaminohydroxyphosphoribosylaminopyrimidine deaminase/5-amino-6-(5-phosphoribosylamino)uracil reductase RibD n=1 Tax=Pseudomonas sp. UBA3153 TaxID=1947313 RepID=UPI00257DE2C4